MTEREDITFGEVLKEHVIRGLVKKITFRNRENGYSVLDVLVQDKGGLAIGDRIKVVGTCVHVNEEEEVIAKGEVINHPRFGEQFLAAHIEQLDPDSSEGIRRYLASGTIKGIGRGTASRLVKEFGNETLEVIHKDPKRLSRVIGRHKARLIKEAFSESSSLKQIMQFLISHKISPNLANKIYARYGDQAVEILTADPYLLAREMKGVGFKTADNIATNGLKLAVDSDARIRGSIIYILEKASDDGHCFLSGEELEAAAYSTLELNEGSVPLTRLRAQIGTLIKENALVEINSRYYLPPIYHAESSVATLVLRKLQPREKPLIPNELATKCIAEAAAELGISFSAEQESAVLCALEYPLLLITGGPGCGKTTLVKALAAVFKAARLELRLTAPTGRAAQRLTQVCDHAASTIHRLLKFQNGSFFYNEKNPLPAQVVVVDEASMVDIFLAKALFAALSDSCTVILVGDKDQLPSVGPGRVFSDLIRSKVVKTVLLSYLFRRGNKSSINDIAHQINNGAMPFIPEPDGKTKVDAYMLPESDAPRALQLVERLVADQVPKKFGFTHSDILVLSPSNRGVLGVANINLKLQERLNPTHLRDESQQIAVGSLTLRLGDRVVQRVNNYNIHEAGVFNGDTGSIISVDRKLAQVKVDLWDGRIITYKDKELSQLNLAYALTVHRSQGSEIGVVVLIVHDSHYTMLERQLVYTGITRAKNLLIIVGTKRALAIASKRITAAERHTYLSEIIQGL
jgi:exodeoxyribonuclease V alpha subunit